MKINKGVVMTGISILMRPVLVHAEIVWEKHGKELVITSGLEGTHSAGSLHYYGLALDLRTRYFNEEEKEIVASELRSRLGSDYDVVIEKTHIHIEHDPK